MCLFVMAFHNATPLSLQAKLAHVAGKTGELAGIKRLDLAPDASLLQTFRAALAPDSYKGS